MLLLPLLGSAPSALPLQAGGRCAGGAAVHGGQNRRLREPRAIPAAVRAAPGRGWGGGDSRVRGAAPVPSLLGGGSAPGARWGPPPVALLSARFAFSRPVVLRGVTDNSVSAGSRRGRWVGRRRGW